MTKDELYRYMKDPSKLNKNTLEELRLLVEAYPYCPTFIFLYLYNLAAIDDLRYHSELKKFAVFIPDRLFLYQMIRKATNEHQWDWAREKKESGSHSFSLVDKYLQSVSDALPHTNNPLHSISDDYFQSIGEKEDEEEDVSNGYINKLKSQRSSTKELQDNEEKILLDDETLLTETLARIYIKQQKYEKALRILRSISLHYPEKSVYFAHQIRFIERIINNK